VLARACLGMLCQWGDCSGRPSDAACELRFWLRHTWGGDVMATTKEDDVTVPASTAAT
jgi:hypothetical protein